MHNEILINDYTNYLNNRNLSSNTIRVYLIYIKKWLSYIGCKRVDKNTFSEFIKNFSSNHQPRSTKLIYNSIIAFLKFQKEYELINEFKDIRLPKIQNHLKTTINLKEFEIVKNNIVCMNNKQKRNWLMFCIMFLTGIRVSELLQVKKSLINDNKIYIIGKGNKKRVIYLTPYLSQLIHEYDTDHIATNSRGENLTIKQINVIIKNIGLNYFNKLITPHSLRRSYATNLLRRNVNLEVVRKTLGHSNINTTATYLQYTDDEIMDELKKALDSTV